MHNAKVTIVMYHYIRDLKCSRYPNIKGLDINHFKYQLEYLCRHYHFISMEELIHAVESNTSLPQKSILLTFDDAYSDHFKYVFPLLDKFKIQGCFYPPALAIKEHSILDVNKIHFILASESNTSRLLKEIEYELEQYQEQYELKSFKYYFDKLAFPSRFDSAEIIFIKRLLQLQLKGEVRNTITNNLFEKIVGIDEKSFSRELYMDIEQIQCLQRNGMHIGSHGYKHDWLAHLSFENQKIEIEKSLEFLDLIGCDTNQWTMCYPYGSFNNETINILSDFNCKLALTTEVNVANIVMHNRYMLPRLDTNDLPKDDNFKKNIWYDKG